MGIYLFVLNPFLTSVPLFSPLKTEHHWFSDVIRGMEIKNWQEMANNEVTRATSIDGTLLLLFLTWNRYLLSGL